MLKTLTILMRGRVAAEEEALIDRCAVPLLDQKIRDCEANLAAAKTTLTAMIQRQRVADRQLADVEGRIADLTERARAAMLAEDTDMLEVAAEAIADLETEASTRRRSAEEVGAKVLRLRASVERAHRRLRDLKQGAAMARAVEREKRAQSGLGRAPATDFAEAEALVSRILGQDDPFEADEIRAGLEDDLSGKGAADRLSEAGYGPRTRMTAADVIARLKTDK